MWPHPNFWSSHTKATPPIGTISMSVSKRPTGIHHQPASPSIAWPTMLMGQGRIAARISTPHPEPQPLLFCWLTFWITIVAARARPFPPAKTSCERVIGTIAAELQPSRVYGVLPISQSFLSM